MGFLFFCVFVPDLFGIDFFPSLEWTSHYVKDGEESKSAALIPSLKMESQSGFLLFADGVFPFKKTLLPSSNSDFSEMHPTGREYVCQMNLGTGFKYVLNPVFSTVFSTQYQYFYHLSEQDDWFAQMSLDFQFLLAASLKAAYSLNHDYMVLELPVSYRWRFGKNLETEIKTLPVYWIGKDKNQVKSWTQSLIFSYPLTEASSLGFSLNYAYSYLREASAFYLTLFLGMEF